ncbi:zinc-binding oxidoreductase protein [Pyrenophora teres f. teres]|uniref:Zinc-binding oxidoreductase protein n=1 Tax=Pyrenophora teres f. teres TaxID=97479 RepID=A0A6S6W8Z4_9PLEO|nr:zinc-binding oxidoreductase protein [Pyrenophora teres f. teres]
MPQNKAAWITSPGAHPFVVKEAPYLSAGPEEVVIKNAVIAINPVEWKIQYHSEEHKYLYNYPFILGSDCVGTVEEVGKGVTRFAKGDRVIAFCPSLPTNNTAQSAFQYYTLVPASHTISIPASLPFKNGVVLPLALATAASGLYPPNLLNLPLPTTPPCKTELKKTVLIWGGSSSVGLAAIQLAVTSGLRVIAACSPANFELVKSVGAEEVFYYRSASAASDVVVSLQQPDTEFAGVYDAISESSSFSMVKFILETLQSKSGTTHNSSWHCKSWLHHISIFGEYHFGEFLPEALENGDMQAKPDAEVVGKGLESMQHGVDVLKKGVSAKKIVVEL